MGTVNTVSLIIYLGLIVFALYLYRKNSGNSFSQINLSDVTFSKIYTVLLPVVLVMIGAALRFYKLSQIPAGLHQDEASIGYEAYILSVFGIDRDGNRYPVYPITYGSGGGSPLMIYLNAVTSFLFGSSSLTLRSLPAILGVITLIVFFFLIKRLSRESFIENKGNLTLQYVLGEYLWLPIVSLCIMALCPWHVMLSRWSLDSNTMPFFVILALLLFIMGAGRQKESTSFESIGTLFKNKDRKKSRTLSASDSVSTLLFAASAFVYALTLYSYGSATFIIPVHLILLCVIFHRKRRITAFQILIGILVFIIVSSPLLLFYAINTLDLPQIITPFFSVTKFTARRSIFTTGEGMLLSALQNLLVIIKNLAIGCSDEQILNYIPGFPPLFAFTFPITLLGVIISMIRVKRGALLDQVILSLFIPAFVFGLFVEEDITRMVLIFIPVIYYMARGYIFVVDAFVTIEKTSASKLVRFFAIFLKSIAPALFMASALFFCKTYFNEFNELSRDAYMPGYGEACAYADKKASGDAIIYSTYEHVSAPFMIALYYTKTNPYDFINTVHYKDPNAEFRIADSFTHFRFGLPEDITDNALSYLSEGNIFILHESQMDTIKNAPGYNPEAVDIKSFGDFLVIVPIS
ncbi:hypothetical protein [Butyrivibrio sp. AE3004]|uniref:hypothetical protein n=1 Tax=Butyrivibrio sp. AE3004 TaxID=1506994 RepID=UPI000493D6CE|nr:hypothetical protein [Butyrivibrio sp. AE3004]